MKRNLLSKFKDAEVLYNDGPVPSEAKELIEFIRAKASQKEEKKLPSFESWEDEYLGKLSQDLGLSFDCFHVEDSFKLLSHCKEELEACLPYLSALKDEISTFNLEAPALIIFLEDSEFHFSFYANLAPRFPDRIFQRSLDALASKLNHSINFTYQLQLSPKEEHLALVLKFVFERRS